MKPWEEAWPGNRCGAAWALTTLAPLPQRRVWLPRLMFGVRRLLGPPKPLAKLSFIYFARTALVEDIEPGRADIYFESHFNGGFDEYIDVFSYVVPQHMKRIWSTADGFPGPKPSTEFNRYIREHDFPAAHFYCAYPEATATDVGRALDLRDALKRLRDAFRLAPPEQFVTRWDDVWRPPPSPPSPGPSLAGLFGRNTNVVRNGRVYGLTVLHRIKPGEREAVDAAIEDLGTRSSPFEELRDTHFARLVILDRWQNAPPHLLFSCIVDGDGDAAIDAYLERLCRDVPTLVDTVWCHCAGAPESGAADPAAFRLWLRRGQLRTTTFFGPYGRASVHDVVAALELRSGARDLARELQNEAPGVVKAQVMGFLDARESSLR